MQVPIQDLAIFTRQMAVMLAAGLSLDKALQSAAQGQPSAHFRAILLDVLDRVISGTRISAALHHHPGAFSSMYCCMVETAEQTGRLQETMSRLSEVTERQLRTQGQLQAMLAYPMVLFIVTMACLAVFIGVVLPMVEPIFLSFGKDLPMATRVLLASRQLLWPGLLLLGAGIAAWFKAGPAWQRFLRRHPGLHQRLSKGWLQIPALGGALRNLSEARILHALHDLLEAGTPLLRAIPLAAGVAPNAWMRERFAASGEMIAAGLTTAQAFRKTRVFNSCVLQLVATGEETASLSLLLLRAGDICEENYQLSVTEGTKLLEPIFMAGMGLVVAFIVIAGMLPMVQMISIL